MKKVKGIPGYTDPDAMRSDYLHKKRDRLEEMQSRLDRIINLAEMLFFDPYRISKMIDRPGHFESTKKQFIFVSF